MLKEQEMGDVSEGDRHVLGFGGEECRMVFISLLSCHCYVPLSHTAPLTLPVRDLILM